MTDRRVGDRVEIKETPHAITAFDFIAQKATLRPIDDKKPLGQHWGSPS